MGRSFCYRCSKPQVVCICDRIVPVRNKTNILILQHKCERSHHVGTVRIALLGLANVEVRVVWPDKEGRFRDQHPAIQGAGLLYPGPGAIDLADLDEAQKPETLVVLDGSWADARSLYRDNQWLQKLPHYKLSPAQPSNYRIRKEPSLESISSIEAIVQALHILEPSTERLDSLLDVFDSMIDDQIRYLEDPSRRRQPRRVQRPKQRASRAVPRLLGQKKDNLVVAYGESVPRTDHTRQLVSWTALRLTDGALFEQFVHPPPNANFTENHLELMGLPADVFDHAVSREELGERWKEFFGEDDLLLTWNAPMLDLFEKLAGMRPLSLYVKDAYCNVRGGKCGHLQNVVQKENLSCPSLALKGRSADRVAELAAVVGLLL